jgi:hypothetical protein
VYLDQIPRRLETLSRDGLGYNIAPGASPEALQATEIRLGVRFPDQVCLFYSAFDGFEVNEPAFRVLPLAEMERDGELLEFCRCDRIHRLAFDTSEINEAGQWFIVDAETGYRVTFTMASFWSVRMWSWIVLRRPIWYDFHGNQSAG